MIVNPPVKKTILNLRNTFNGANHATGDFLSTNNYTTGLGVGIYSATHLNITDVNQLSTYTGHVRVSIDAIRRIDGSTLHIGTARFSISPTNNNIRTLTPLEKDAAWDSWTNSSQTGVTLQAYLSGIIATSGSAGVQFSFLKQLFATRELDPVYNVPFNNAYALDYFIKIELLHRKVNDVNNTSIIKLCPNILGNGGATLLGYRPINDGVNGVDAAKAIHFNRAAVNSPRGIWIMNTPQLDFIYAGRYVNETEAAGATICMPFTEATKSDGVDKHPYQFDWIRAMRVQFQPATGSAGLPMGFFEVEESDPNNGGNPTIYHQTAWAAGGIAATRKLGFTSLSGIGSSANTIPTTQTAGVWSRPSTMSKFPIITSMGDCTPTLGALAGLIFIHALDISTKTNGRPIIFSNVLAGNYIWVNNGTYATPDYTTILSIGYSAVVDTGFVKFAHNAVSLPAYMKQKATILARAGDNGWMYLILIAPANVSHRHLVRIKYTGPATKTHAEVWDWANWTTEELADWADFGSDTVVNDIATTTYNFNTWASQELTPTQYVDTSDMVNGYPTFWSIMSGKIVRTRHNGGVSATKAENWDLTVLGGGALAAATEGQGFGFTLGVNISNTNWLHRKDKKGEWLYFGNYSDNFIGRINITGTSLDYLKFELVTSTYSTSQTHERF